jgi:catechol 2,3-dioxygenase-like lactoylglutathione lyase family enzyme
LKLDHVVLYASDVVKSRAFYEALLPFAGLVLNRDFGEVAVGFGDDNYAVLALVRQKDPIQTTHLAFRVETRDEVDKYYTQALQAGGLDNGKPGLRPDYHEHYYAAFIRDPDGHNLEFVCHKNPSD